MVILRNEERIIRLKRYAQAFTVLGMVVLFLGLFIGWAPETSSYLGLSENQILLAPLITLPLGVLFSQLGIRLAHLYIRSPRPDEVVDKSLKKISTSKFRLYHYTIPNIPHLLLTPSGPVVLVAKYQRGYIRAEKNRWHQSFSENPTLISKVVDILRKIFGRESIGNPTQEAEAQLARLIRYLKKHAPEIEELPLAAVIIFTIADKKNLDLNRSPIPAVHHTKISNLLKQKLGAPIPIEQYQQIQTALDESINWSL